MVSAGDLRSDGYIPTKYFILHHLICVANAILQGQVSPGSVEFLLKLLEAHS